MRDPKIDRTQELTNQFIIVPYYLEKPKPELKTIVQGAEGLLPDGALTGDPRHDLPAIHRPLRDRAQTIAAAGGRPVSIAGDCCTAIALEAGLRAAGLDPLVIWFDAHGDFNTWETSPSGFLGGMPLAMLVGRGEQHYLHALDVSAVAESGVILAGARDLDPGEAAALAASQVRQVPNVSDLLAFDWPDRPIHIHFDADVIDPADAPAVDYRTPGGPSAKELQAVFEHIAASGRLAAVSIAAWNPELDADGQTRRTCLSLLSTLLGQKL